MEICVVYFFLTIMNLAAINTHVQFCMNMFSILLGIYIRRELLNHMIIPKY